jgi:hypothetical protein
MKKLNSFEILHHENVNDIMLWLNVLVLVVNGLGRTQLTQMDVVRKILNVLLTKRYVHIITVLHHISLLGAHSIFSHNIHLGKLCASQSIHYLYKDIHHCASPNKIEPTPTLSRRRCLAKHFYSTTQFHSSICNIIDSSFGILNTKW